MLISGKCKFKQSVPKSLFLILQQKMFHLLVHFTVCLTLDKINQNMIIFDRQVIMWIFFYLVDIDLGQ